MKKILNICALCVAAIIVVAPLGAQEIERRPRDASYSADAKRIAYCEQEYRKGSTAAMTCEIWTINANGTYAKRLTSGHSDNGPRWSRDGKRVAFVRAADIWLVNADGSGLKNLTASKEGIESAVEFSADGASLLFLRDTPVELMGSWFRSGNALVMRNLTSGAERVILPSDLGLKQVSIDAKTGAAYAVCGKIDSNGKPVKDPTFEKVLAKVDLQSGKMRPFFALDRKTHPRLRIEGIRCASGRILVDTSGGDTKNGNLGILENNKFTLVPDTPIMGDISFDGRELVGSGLIYNEPLWGIVRYDLEGRRMVDELEIGIMDAAKREGKTHFILAAEHYTANRYADAIRAYSENIRLNPKAAYAFYGRGLCYSQTAELDRAIADYSTAIGMKPLDGDIFAARAEAYLAQGDKENATRDFGSASSFLPRAQRPEMLRKHAALLREKGITIMAEYDEKLAARIEAELKAEAKAP